MTTRIAALHRAPSHARLDVDGLRAVCALPGTLNAVLSVNDALAVLDVTTREMTTFESGVLNRWDEPAPFSALAGLGANSFFAVSVDTGFRIALRDGGCTVEHKVNTGSERSHAWFIHAAASARGEVCAAVLIDRLLRLPAHGPALMLEAEAADSFTQVGVSADGSTVATCHENGLLELRDAATLAVTRVLRPAGGPMVLTVAFSPDGRYLATGDDLPVLELWDLATARATELPIPGKIVSLAWLADGSGFLAVELGGHVLGFDVANLERPVFELDGLGGDDGRLVGGCLAADRVLLLKLIGGLRIVDFGAA